MDDKSRPVKLKFSATHWKERIYVTIGLPDDPLARRDPMPAKPALAAADELSGPGPAGIDDIEMPAPAVSAAEPSVVIALVLSLRFFLHARFLRCSSAKLIRWRLTVVTLPPVPASTDP